jgi:hypothetical protein
MVPSGDLNQEHEMKTLSMSVRLLAVTFFAAFTTTAMAITGVWTGHLRDSQGNAEVTTYRFSDSGYPILKFASRGGWREFEVRSVGQRQEWLLRGPGYSTAVVRALAVTNDRVQLILGISTNSGSGALLDQGERRLGLDFKLGSNGLETVVISESLNYSSGAGLGLYAGSRSRFVREGVLRPAS